MTDNEIQTLINTSKQIYKKEPRNRYKEESNYKRCNLTLRGRENDGINFDVFIRQNQTFIENFSIGLICKFSELSSPVQLIRYNGSHDSRDNIIHHLKPHIHCVTQEEIQSGNLNTQIKIYKLQMNIMYLKKDLGLF